MARAREVGGSRGDGAQRETGETQEGEQRAESGMEVRERSMA